MKTYLNYFICLLFFAACGLDDCGIYNLSHGDQAFIPYQINDSIRVNYVDYNDPAFSSSYILNTTQRKIDTAFEDLIFEVCENAFEKQTIILENCSGIVGYNKIILTIDCEEAGFNVNYNFHSNDTTQRTKAHYYNYAFYSTENKMVRNFSSKKIDGQDYENVFLFEQSDSLLYSPHYGLIKLYSTTGIYTFKNL